MVPHTTGQVSREGVALISAESRLELLRLVGSVVGYGIALSKQTETWLRHSAMATGCGSLDPTCSFADSYTIGKLSEAVGMRWLVRLARGRRSLMGPYTCGDRTMAWGLPCYQGCLRDCCRGLLTACTVTPLYAT
jgi:hypothetical protein